MIKISSDSPTVTPCFSMINFKVLGPSSRATFPLIVPSELEVKGAPFSPLIIGYQREFGKSGQLAV